MKKKIPKILCILPIRSGSKEVKNKNILNFRGNPLSYYAITVAIKSKIFDKIIIATDSKKYVHIIKKFTKNKKVEFFIRSKKSASDNAQTELVVKEVLKKFNSFDNTFLMQVTSPFINKNDLKLALTKFKKEKLDSLFSCYLTKKFFWINRNNVLNPINYNFKKRPMRQKHKKTMVENGAFYIFKNSKFHKYNNRLFGKIGSFIMPKERSIEIDSLADFRNSNKN